MFPLNLCRPCILLYILLQQKIAGYNKRKDHTNILFRQEYKKFQVKHSFVHTHAQADLYDLCSFDDKNFICV